MHGEPAANRGDRHWPRKVALVQNRPHRATALARRRRLNALVRELARDLGFNLDAVTLSEKAVLQQCATLILQVEIAQVQLIGGAVIDPDVCIRLSSEARRLLAGLRKRAKPEALAPSPPWSPLRSALAKAVTLKPTDD
jgi:hypothetical protein